MSVMRILALLLLTFAPALHARASAQVPQLIHYQSRMAVNGVHFEGSGEFKFALVNAEGTTTTANAWQQRVNETDRIGAPAARQEHTVVWTGSEMIVWGGIGSTNTFLNDTFSYIPD